MSVTAIYPVPLDLACAVAAQAELPVGSTFIEPARFVGTLFETASDATLFVLRFNDARLWPADDPEVFLLIAPASDEIQDWLDEHRLDTQRIEIVAVQFATASDHRTFEAALWP